MNSIQQFACPVVCVIPHIYIVIFSSLFFKKDVTIKEDWSEEDDGEEEEAISNMQLTVVAEVGF